MVTGVERSRHFVIGRKQDNIAIGSSEYLYIVE